MDSNTSLSTWERQMVNDFQLTPEDTGLVRIKKQVYNFLTNSKSSKLAYYWSIFITTVVIASVFVLVIQSVESLNDTPAEQEAFFAVDGLFTAIFSVEYFSRIIFCPNYKYLPRLLVQPSWLIDFLSIIPFYVEAAARGSNAADFAVIRVLRLLRIFRLFKANRNAQKLRIVFQALQRSKNGVGLLAFIMLNLAFISATFVYYAELEISERINGVWFYTSGPLAGQRSEFQSIPHSLWWAIVTLTTVGYGDMYPTSGLGKFFGSCAMFCGTLCLGFPTTVIGIHMSELYEEYRSRKGYKDAEKEVKMKQLDRIRAKLQQSNAAEWTSEDERTFGAILTSISTNKKLAEDLQTSLEQVKRYNAKIKEQLMELATSQ